MKKLFSLLFLFVVSNSFAMDKSIETNDVGVSENRKMVSMLDAYMSGNMIRINRKKLRFPDYEYPILMHSYSIKNINEIVHMVSQKLTQGISEEDEPVVESAFNKFKSDPLNFNEEEANIVQIIRMGDFLLGNDLPELLDKSERLFIMANRAQYQSVWAIRNAKRITTAMEVLQLHSDEKPYLSIAQQLSVFKELSVRKLTPRVDE